MKNDKTSYIGLFLIGLLLFGWMYYQAPSEKEIAKEKAKHDSIARVEKQKADQQQAAATAQTNTNKPLTDSARRADSANILNKVRNESGIFYTALKGTDKDIVLENDLLKATVTAKGGKISTVELKNFKTSAGAPLILFFPKDNRFSLVLNAYSKFFSTDSLYFSQVGELVTKGDSSILTMQLNTTDPDKYLQFVYTIKKASYMLGFKVKAVGMQSIIPANSQEINLEWSMATPSQEAVKDSANQRRASTVYYKYHGSDVDNLSPMKDEKKALSTDLSWVAFKQDFFSSILITNSKFGSPEVSTADGKDAAHMKLYTASLSIPYGHMANESFDMQFYFGPNNFKILKSYSGDNDFQFEKLINLGSGIFGWFGKPINTWIIIPLFNFLNQFNMNYGLVILILTLVIKAILFPIAFRTYVSSAKMRILKPEIDEINKKFPKTEDAMKKQQGVMALYKKAGINPMAGCLPVLLQIPVLSALFSFFPASIELRQQHFLWATDMSTYDSVYNFPNHFSIPLYGDHISVFALLMTLSQYLYLTANQQLMGSPAGGTDQMAKMMKWMMYLMPIMFLSVLNKYSAGLSYYYFLANLITFAQTFIARKFIDEDALHRKMQENKAKPIKQSKFQARLEQMMKDQQAAKKGSRK
ncbi:MAG TPA: membrane protein insertase YidC [Bacteroidia bacterium]|nr:membrane protein insertase YidC [Bacteroidia bacterium]